MEPIEPFGADELRPMLERLLAPCQGDGEAPRRQVVSFQEYLAQPTLAWEGFRCGPRSQPAGIFLTVLLPGRTAIVMIPQPGSAGIDDASQLRVTRFGVERLLDRGQRGAPLHYVQALVEPESPAKRSIFERAGFARLAPLIYLERSVRSPAFTPPAPAEATWVAYDDRTRADFAATLAETYRESRDCPELSGVRPVEDILAAHQASGRFRPDLWELARIDGRLAGCLLLVPLMQGPVVEVTYMGVVPEFRGRGVGGLLLRRALQRCGQIGARQITLVVDERNAPARALYARFAFTTVARRDAYWIAASRRAGAAAAAR